MKHLAQVILIAGGLMILIHQLVDGVIIHVLPLMIKIRVKELKLAQELIVSGLEDYAILHSCNLLEEVQQVMVWSVGYLMVMKQVVILKKVVLGRIIIMLSV